MTHAFFEGVRFEDFLAQKIAAPWVPELKTQRDTCFFEKYTEIDESMTEIPPEVDRDLFSDF